jgi:hypothetical protein
VSVATPPVAPAPTAAPPPADEACPLCGASLEPEQEWCLRCGAAARTRLAASPAWKTPVIAFAVVVALSLGVLAAALVKLAGGDSGHAATAPTTITVTAPATTPTATVPTATVLTTTTPATPGTSTPSTTLSTTTASPGAKSSTGASGLSTPKAATTAPGLTAPTAKTTPKTITTPTRTKSSEAPPSSNPLVAPESPKK